MATAPITSTQAWARLRRRVVGIGKRKVIVGILGNASLAKIARHHEYGAPRAGIPQRSFLRSTMREREADIAQLMARLARSFLAGRMDPTRVLNTLGLYAANAVKAKIRSNIAPPLSSRTIARKGSSKALIDKGRLINSIRWEIVP